MSVKTVLTPPFCENGCVFLCDICAHNMAATAAKLAEQDADDEMLDMCNMYPTGGTVDKPIIPVFTEVQPKIIKITEILVVKPLESPLPLKMTEGEIVTYPE